jgi:hypothetical protein
MHINPRQIKSMGFLFTLGIITSVIILAALAAFAVTTGCELFSRKHFLCIGCHYIFLGFSFFGIFTVNVPSIP